MKRLTVILCIAFMLLTALPPVFFILLWNKAAPEASGYERANIMLKMVKYICIPVIAIVYCRFVYLIAASLFFYLKFRDRGAACYYFDKDKLYIHSRFAPIPVEKIEYIRIIPFMLGDKTGGIKAAVKLKNRLLKYKFTLGIAGLIRTDTAKLHEALIKDLRKRKIYFKHR